MERVSMLFFFSCVCHCLRRRTEAAAEGTNRCALARDTSQPSEKLARRVKDGFGYPSPSTSIKEAERTQAALHNPLFSPGISG